MADRKAPDSLLARRAILWLLLEVFVIAVAFPAVFCYVRWGFQGLALYVVLLSLVFVGQVDRMTYPDRQTKR